MMHAIVKNQNGEVLETRVVDPAAPGGMSKQLQTIAADRSSQVYSNNLGYPIPRQQERRLERQALERQALERQALERRALEHRALERQVWQQPVVANCHFSVNVGGVWREIPAPCPPGVPPGRYVRR
jgi:hypothetical protein